MASMMIESGQQLGDELARTALGTRRPILTHLNADTTWLLQLPYPRAAVCPPGRTHFNVLIDPWFSGPQSDVASWFSTQWHVVPSSVQSVAELDAKLKEVVTLRTGSDPADGEGHTTYIDAVVLSHEFTDHTHRATLLEIDRSVPVFATEKAAALVRSWGHFETVRTTPAFTPKDPDWRKTSIAPLPRWIGISRIVSEGNSLYYHSAIMVTFDADKGDEAGHLKEEDTAEAVIYSPHGIVADDLRHLPNAVPPVETLALLHGLHDVRITLTKQLNLGAHNGLRAQRMCRARYWVGTHDEVKKGGGLIAPFLRRSQLTIKKALERERAEEKKKKKKTLSSGALSDMQDVNFAELRSGENLLLV